MEDQCNLNISVSQSNKCGELIDVFLVPYSIDALMHIKQKQERETEDVDYEEVEEETPLIQGRNLLNEMNTHKR